MTNEEMNHQNNDKEKTLLQVMRSDKNVRNIALSYLTGQRDEAGYPISEECGYDDQDTVLYTIMANMVEDQQAEVDVATRHLKKTSEYQTVQEERGVLKGMQKALEQYRIFINYYPKDQDNQTIQE